MTSLDRLRQFWLTWRYETIAVVNGAVIMVFELVGARMIAPYFGNSIYVWTAVIGVILGALAAGYWQGGRLADDGASDRNLSLILLVAAGCLLVGVVLQNVILGALAQPESLDLRMRALLAALILFAPANLLMGMVSPYLAKLKLRSLERAGSSIGGLYAAGTLGSIVGTFAAGYWLVAWLGSRALGLSLVLGLVIASWLAGGRRLGWLRLGLAIVTGACLAWPVKPQSLLPGGIVRYDGDSAYSRYQVIDMPGERPQRLLVTDNQDEQSGVYTDGPNDAPFSYIRASVRAAQAAAPVQRVLILGGGAYTLPRLILQQYPAAHVDVVEIDPQLDDLAKRYFGYQPDERVRLIHADGRTFLNANHEHYDVIYMDAFNSLAPPFQLTTVETASRLARSLAPGGVVVVNLVSARQGSWAALMNAEYATYRQVFPVAQVDLPEATALAPEVRQNLMLVAGPTGGRAERVAQVLGKAGAVRPAAAAPLTDDFAPVEQMVAE